ncbi:MAG TPA: ABC transporter permease subunit [Bryobacteraceae bacterium]|jgi:NitT/TauT family transport system permease protein|nr:ABC transporter permease subunit [Bryobacteraceae bacterium]
MALSLFSRPIVGERSWSWLVDGLVFLIVAAGVYGVLNVAHYWFGAAFPATEISQSPRALPRYAFYSLVRIGVAYVLSLVFAIGYGYIAAHQPKLQNIMIAALDILQSIPVLSFLPGVMLAMVAVIPSRQLGVELGSIILIFTGQVWNIAFSFYSSLKSIPRELQEAAAIYGFSPWQKFIELELPSGVIGLVWNSIVSVAGGWFFLMACEMFVLGKRDFRLPGLGSYLQTAASAGNTTAILWGLGAMITVIVLVDQLVWRPAIAWSDRFKFEQTERANVPYSPILHLFRHSSAFRWLSKRAFTPAWERLTSGAVLPKRPESRKPSRVTPVLARAAAAVAILLALYALFDAAKVLSGITAEELISTCKAAGATFVRVVFALAIASLWTIPAGVAIGFHPKLARIAQPVAQVVASVPATALFPIVLLGLVRLGGSLNVAAVALMLLGTMWYILFNVIAGATAIPTELREAAAVFRFRNLQQWRTLILPGIFPYLVTGLITASGGAWNASIVAEYFHFRGQTLTTLGLGAQISSATDTGNFDLLLVSTLVMALLVVCINRLVWRPLYHLAETRFRLET